MTLYVSTLYQVKEMDTSLVGVFSSIPQAISAGENAIREFTCKEPVMLDWDHEDIEDRIFFDGFTLTITEVTLNKAI